MSRGIDQEESLFETTEVVRHFQNFLRRIILGTYASKTKVVSHPNHMNMSHIFLQGKWVISPEKKYVLQDAGNRGLAEELPKAILIEFQKQLESGSNVFLNIDISCFSFNQISIRLYSFERT